MPTKIQWTDESWNPIRGCSIVEPECANCYARDMAARFCDPGMPYHGLATRSEKRGLPQWTGKVAFIAEMLDRPIRWRRPRRIFTNSMSDLFHEELTNEQIAAVFGVMAAAHWHTFQVLTKRPQRALEWFAWAAGNPGDALGRALEAQHWSEEMAGAVTNWVSGWSRWKSAPHDGNPLDGTVPRWPLPNVHLYVSAGSQDTADRFIPILLELPAVVRGVSAEPLIGPLDLTRYMWPLCESWPAEYASPGEARAAGAVVKRKRQSLVSAHSRFLDHVIVGGESGPRARRCHLEWIRRIVRDGQDSGTLVFVKQLGARAIDSMDSSDEPHVEVWSKTRKGDDMSEWPEELRIRELPKARV